MNYSMKQYNLGRKTCELWKYLKDMNSLCQSSKCVEINGTKWKHKTNMWMS
jgi:hypothetical protein